MALNNLVQQKLMEKSIKQEIEQTLSLRAQRYLKVKPHGIVPNTQFAPVSAECNLLFRDGHIMGASLSLNLLLRPLFDFFVKKILGDQKRILKTI